MQDCIFCKIINGDIPSYKVYEDDNVFAMLDINPAVEGHTLVLPKKHTEGFQTIDNDSLNEVMRAAQQLTGIYANKLGAKGFNLWNNSGEVAEQDIFHFHLHLLPRFKDDGFSLAAKPNKSIAVEDIYRKIVS